MVEEKTPTLLDQFLRPDGEVRHVPRRRAQEYLDVSIQSPE